MARMSPERVGPPDQLEQRYRRLLAEHAKSDLTQRDFAANKGVPATTLSWWRHEIARRDRIRAERNGKRAQPSSLVPVQLVTAAMDRQSDPTEAVEFVVRLRSGRVVRVRRGFDAGELRRLIEVLEAC
jgi:hypothetical protein